MAAKKQREREREGPGEKLPFKDMSSVTYIVQLGPTS
jgi:hypothetical protein